MDRIPGDHDSLTFAHRQVDAIAEMLTQHQPVGTGCRCGRQAECPVAELLRKRQRHYSQVIALAERTVLVPVITLPAHRSDLRVRRHKAGRRWWG